MRNNRIKPLFWIIAIFSLILNLPNASAVLVDVIQTEILCNDGNERMGYTMIDQINPDTARTNDNVVVRNETTKIFITVQFATNSTRFPYNSTHQTRVLESNLTMKNIGDPTGGIFSVHLVKQVGGANGTHNYGVSTFNTENPCAGYSTSDAYASFYLSGMCNASSENFTTISSGVNVVRNVTWNVTNAVQNRIVNNSENITLAVVSNSGHATFATQHNNAQPACLEIIYKIIEL